MTGRRGVDLLDALENATSVISNSSGDAPLLNGSKRGFVHRLLLSTLFGGVVFVKGEDAWKIHTLQAILFLFPALILVVGLVVGNATTSVAGACVSAALGCVSTLSLLLFAKRGGNSSDNVLFSGLEMDDDGVVDTPFPFFSKEHLTFIVASEQSIAMCSVRGIVSGLFFAAITNTLVRQQPLSSGASIAVCLFVGFTVCVAHFSLLVARVPEPLAFANKGTWMDKVDVLSRPLLCALLSVLGDVLQHFFAHVNASLRLVFLCVICALPLAWFLAKAPPISSLVIYLLQQLNVFGLGGSTSRSYTSLLSSVVVGCLLWCLLVIVWTEMRNKSVPIVATVLCAIYSITFTSKHPLAIATSLFSKSKVYPMETSSSNSSSRSSSTSSSSVTVSVYHTLALVSVTLCSSLVTLLAVLPSSSDTFGDDSAVVFLCIFGVLLFLHSLFTALQQSFPDGHLSKTFPFLFSVLFLFSRARNPIHRHTQSLQHNSVFKFMCSSLRYAMVLFVLSAVVGFGSFGNTSTSSLTTAAIHSLLFMRAFRASLQRPAQSALEVFVTLLIRVGLGTFPSAYVSLSSSSIVYSSTAATLWSNVPFLQQLLVVSFTLTRAHGLWLRLKFVVVTTVTTFTSKENKLSYARELAVFLIFFSPFTIGMILGSTLLDTPLVPLFCLPIFVCSYPRPKMLWPGDSEAPIDTTKGDGAYYRAARDEVATLLQQMRSCLVAGELFEGQSFLIRFENKLVTASVCESAFDYAAFEVKGLELVETSCHTVEASHLEEVIERTWKYKPASIRKKKKTMKNSHNGVAVSVDGGDGNDQQSVLQRRLQMQRQQKNSSSGGCLGHLDWGLRPQGMDCFTPLTQTYINTYTDTSSSLTGVLDAPYVGNVLHRCVTYALCFAVSEKEKEMKLQSTTDRQNTVRNVDDVRVVNRFLKKITGTTQTTEEHSQSVRVQLLNDTNGDDWGDEDVSDIVEKTSGNWKEAFVLSVLNTFFHDGPPALVYVLLSSASSHSFVHSGDNHAQQQQKQRMFDGEHDDVQHIIRMCSSHALKLAIDFVTSSFGDETIDEEEEDEMLDTLIEFQREWYLGPEGIEWFNALNIKKPKLFSIKRDGESGELRTHLITTQHVPAHIVELNHQAMNGLWLNVSWELLYLTNDDEERYSIQAHKQLLRNLTTQAADPPLGYPVFSDIIKV
eukprot:m.221799 g.221799  ORF g.221799 m.221799 type:complete len:1182 (+) comp13846_c0_seq2:74-3619(+)